MKMGEEENSMRFTICTTACDPEFGARTSERITPFVHSRNVEINFTLKSSLSVKTDIKMVHKMDSEVTPRLLGSHGKQLLSRSVEGPTDEPQSYTCLLHL